MLWLATLLTTVGLAHADNFSTTFGTSPTSCDDYTVSWNGGEAPFTLTLIPSFGTPRTFDIPADAFSNGQGTYSAPIAFPNGQVLAAVMGDKSGFGAGGVSTLLTVGSSTSNNVCNTIDPGVDFEFILDSALTQCNNYVMDGYTTRAVLPVTFRAIVPGGTAFTVGQTSEPTLSWQTNVAAGNGMMFWAFDAQGRNGGASDVKLVGISNDVSCLSGSSPSSTVVASPSSTASAMPSSTSAAANDSENTLVAGIAGAVVGGILGIAIIVSLCVFFSKQRRDGKWDGTGRRSSKRFHSNVDLAEEGYPYTYENNQSGRAGRQPSPPPTFVQPGQTQYDTNPFILPPTQSDYNPYSPTTTDGFHAGAGAFPIRQSTTTTNMSSAARRKAVAAGSAPIKPPRFVLHTDAEEHPDDEEVIELPPQYSDSRRPIGSSSHSYSPLSPIPSSSTHLRDDNSY